MIQGYHDRVHYEQGDNRDGGQQQSYHAVSHSNYQDRPAQAPTTTAYQPSTVTYYRPSQHGQQATSTTYTPATATYTPTKSYTQAHDHSRQQSPGRDTVTLVENHPDYKVYQYRSVKKESTHIDDRNRRVVHGDTYSDGTPVKRTSVSRQDSPNVPFNPRRSTTFSNSKYITVVRNGREVMEEIYDYN